MAQTRVGIRNGALFNNNIITDGLVLHLDAGNTLSYPGTGTNWFDLTSNNNNGVLTNGAIYNSNNGGVISFDGLNDYVDFGGNILDNVISGNNNFTINCWVYKRSDNGMILSAWESSPNRKMYIGFIGGKFRLVGSSNGSNFFIAESNMLSNNNWYNITVTRLGNNGNSGIYIYINSILQSLSFTDIFTTIISNSINYRLGNRQELSSTFQYHGDIAQVKIYNKVLTQEEIQQNFNATKSRFGL
jgi:hypothetical protein